MTNNSGESIRRPELVLGDLLKKHARGEIVTSDFLPKILYRAVVLAVDVEGGKLSGANIGNDTVNGVGVDGRERDYTRISGPSNPRGSIKAIVIDSARDSFYDEDSARILWPFFPNDQMSLPVSPGEHVYCIFEDELMEHGLWVCRVSGHDTANVSKGADFLSGDKKQLNDLFSGEKSKTEIRTSDDVSTRIKPSRKRLVKLFNGE